VKKERKKSIKKKYMLKEKTEKEERKN